MMAMTQRLPAELPALTGIRGLGALWVVSLHFGPEWSELFPVWAKLQPLWARGQEGVSLFYVLSGFILAHVYQPHLFTASQFAGFIKHRLIRIYPLHVATLLALAALVIGSQVLRISITGEYAWSAFGWNLLLLQKFPGIVAEGWNYPAWTISVEWFAYLLAFPLGCWICQRVSRWAPWTLGGLSLLLILGSHVATGDDIYSNTSACLHGSLLFLSGMMLHQFVNLQQQVPRRVAWFGNVALAAVPVVLFLGSDALCRPFCQLAWPAVILGCLLPRMPATKLLSASFFRIAGVLSYSLYMSHALTEKALKILLPTAAYSASSLGVRLLVIGGHLLAISLVTGMFFSLIEQPSRRWLRTRLG